MKMNNAVNAAIATVLLHSISNTPIIHKLEAYATLPFIQTVTLRAFDNFSIFITKEFMKADFTNNDFFFCGYKWRFVQFPFIKKPQAENDRHWPPGK